MQLPRFVPGYFVCFLSGSHDDIDSVDTTCHRWIWLVIPRLSFLLASTDSWLTWQEPVTLNPSLNPLPEIICFNSRVVTAMASCPDSSKGWSQRHPNNERELHLWRPSFWKGTSERQSRCDPHHSKRRNLHPTVCHSGPDPPLSWERHPFPWSPRGLTCWGGQKWEQVIFCQAASRLRRKAARQNESWCRTYLEHPGTCQITGSLQSPEQHLPKLQARQQAKRRSALVEQPSPCSASNNA